MSYYVKKCRLCALLFLKRTLIWLLKQPGTATEHGTLEGHIIEFHRRGGKRYRNGYFHTTQRAWSGHPIIRTV